MTQTTQPVRKDHLDALAISLLLACCLYWGFQQVLVKATIPYMAPVLQTALRFLIATIALWGWCRWRGIALFARDGSFWPGVLAGMLFATEFACIQIGLNYTSASRVTMFLYTSPFWVSALLPLFVRAERLRPMQWVGLACAFGAVVFALRAGFTHGGKAGEDAMWIGDLLGLAAGMFWGLTTVSIRATSLTRISPHKLLFYQVAVSTVTLPLLSLFLGESWSPQWNGFVWMSMAVQAMVGAFVTYLAWMWMLGRYPATKISSFVFLTPVFALLFGALWLHEAVTPGLLIALVLVAVGIVLVNRRSSA